MFSLSDLHIGLDVLWGSAPTTNTASSAIFLPFSTQKKALCIRAGLQPSTAVLPDAAHTSSDFMTDYCHTNHKAALPCQPQPKFLTWRIHEALQPSTRPCKQSYPQLFNRKGIVDPHSERQWDRRQQLTEPRPHLLWQLLRPRRCSRAGRGGRGGWPRYRCTWCLCCKGPGSAWNLFETFPCQITFWYVDMNTLFCLSKKGQILLAYLVINLKFKSKSLQYCFTWSLVVQHLKAWHAEDQTSSQCQDVLFWRCPLLPVQWDPEKIAPAPLTNQPHLLGFSGRIARKCARKKLKF